VDYLLKICRYAYKDFVKRKRADYKAHFYPRDANGNIDVDSIFEKCSIKSFNTGKEIDNEIN